MGVKGLRAWLFARFPKVITSFVQHHIPTKLRSPDPHGIPFDHVLVDMNSIFYQAAGRSFGNEERLVRQVFLDLDRQLRLCRPIKSVMLAVDGPAPRAKLVLQRQRRLKNALRHSNPTDFNIVQITPGTPFLKRMDSHLMDYAMRNVTSKFRNVQFVIAGGLSPGEGELKMVEYMLRSGKVATEDTVAMISNDSDLMLLGLGSQHRNAFCLTSELVHPRSSVGKFVSCQGIRLALSELFPKSDVGTSVLDLTALILLGLGNDYMPKVSGLSLKALFPSYVSLKQEDPTRSVVSPNGRTLDLHMLVDVLRRIVSKSHPDAQAAAKKKKPRWSDDVLETLVRQYLQTVVWNLDMYAQGRCPNYEWCLPPGIASSGPNLAEIFRFFEMYPDRLLHVPTGATQPLLPYQFAATVMPRQGAEFLPAPMRHIVESYTDLCGDTSDEFSIDRVLKALDESVSPESFSEEDRAVLSFHPWKSVQRTPNMKKYKSTQPIASAAHNAVLVETLQDFVPKAPRNWALPHCNDVHLPAYQPFQKDITYMGVTLHFDSRHHPTTAKEGTTAKELEEDSDEL